jgi:hypothetical protein
MHCNKNIIEQTDTMRVTYVEPSVEEFSRLFDSNIIRHGGGLADIATFNSPVYYQRGSGFFSILSSIAKRSIPFLKRVLLPSVADMSANIVKDYGKGIPLKKALRNRGIESLKRVGKKIMKGGKRLRKSNKKKAKGIKRKRKMKVKIKRQTCQTIAKDIFDRY